MPLTDDVSGNQPGQASRRSGPQGPLRPAWAIRMIVRLEDWTNNEAATAIAEGKPLPDLRKAMQVRQARSDAEVATLRAAGRNDLETEAQAKRVARGAKIAKGGKGAQGGPAPENVGRDDLSIELFAIPTNVDLELNTFRQADRLTATIPLRDLPLLPEMVRSMLIEFYAGAVPPEATGDPQQWAPLPSRTGRYPMFRGYATEIVTAVGTDYQVQIQAHSLEQVLMDKEIDPLSPMRKVRGDGEEVVEYLRRFISTIPEFSGAIGGQAIQVLYYPAKQPGEDPGSDFLDRKLFVRTLQTAASRNQAAGGQVDAAGLPPGTDPSAVAGTGNPMLPAPSLGARLKAWDVIVRAAELAGRIPLYDPTINPDAILLVKPQQLFQAPDGGVAITGGTHDGFQRQFLQGGTSIVKSQVRIMLWGRNLKSMRFERKFGRLKPRQVRVVFYNADARGKNKISVVTYPKKPFASAISAVGSERARGYGKGHRPIEEVVTIPLRGVRTVAAAEQAAVGLYHALNKQEMSAQLETDDLASFIDPAFPEDQNNNADLLALRPGTPVRVMIAEQEVDPSKGLVVNTLSEIFARRHNPAFLRKLLAEQRFRAGAFRDERDFVALEQALQRIEQSYDSAKITDWFFVRTVRHSFSSEDGGLYACKMEVMNYVEARNDPANLSAQDAKLAGLTKKRDPKARAAREGREQLERQTAQGR